MEFPIAFITVIFIIMIIIYNNRKETFEAKKTFCIKKTCYKAFDNSSARVMSKLDRDVKTVIDHLTTWYGSIDTRVATTREKELKELAENLKDRYDAKALVEHLPSDPRNSSYVLNKGKKIALCLRDSNGKLHNMSTLQFVKLHEITHIADSSHDPKHKPPFWKKFKLILEEAEKIGIYVPIKYSIKPTKYCGMTIRYNPYYDTKLI